MADSATLGAIVFVPSGTDDPTPFYPAVVVKAYGEFADVEVFGGPFRNVVLSTSVVADPSAAPSDGTVYSVLSTASK